MAGYTFTEMLKMGYEKDMLRRSVQKKEKLIYRIIRYLKTDFQDNNRDPVGGLLGKL